MYEKDSVLCLRWSSNSTKVNFPTYFQDLRNDLDFLDVSIGCTDDDDGQSCSKSMKAHKTILAAYSSIFKDILRQHQNENNPFIFLHGMSFENLSLMIDFMYQGEVCISQGKLNKFLACASELKIKGLFEENGNASALLQKQNSSIKTEAKGLLFGLNGGSESSKHTQNYNHNNSILDSFPGPSHKKERRDRKEFKYIKETETEINLQNARDEDDSTGTATASALVDDTASIDAFILLTGKKIITGNRKRIAAKCKICGKVAQDDYIKHHIRTKHATLFHTQKENFPQAKEVGESNNDGNVEGKYEGSDIRNEINSIITNAENIFEDKKTVLEDKMFVAIGEQGNENLKNCEETYNKAVQTAKKRRKLKEQEDNNDQVEKIVENSQTFIVKDSKNINRKYVKCQFCEKDFRADYIKAHLRCEVRNDFEHSD